jgi:hypothetical protein
MKMIAPEIVPEVYTAGQGFWAYPTLLVILGATIWNRDKAAATGTVEPRVGNMQ